MSIKELESNGELQLLVFLLKNGKTKITDIDIEASSGTLYRALNALAQLELIDEERKPPTKRYMKLTGDGQAIAKKLTEVEDILKAKRDRLQHQNPP